MYFMKKPIAVACFCFLLSHKNVFLDIPKYDRIRFYQKKTNDK